jgi:hypothetical protein
LGFIWYYFLVYIPLYLVLLRRENFDLSLIDGGIVHQSDGPASPKTTARRGEAAGRWDFSCRHQPTTNDWL